jgi:Serine/threonine protein kinase
MNAEDLCGKVLGTCTLQKVIGRGGMGAVYLAQQTRPHRQVAVKVFMPISTLQPNQHKAFLERFRRETDAAASLEHPNIVPVHEYGELEGLAYLVMPYVSGGTLRDELETEGRLPLLRIVLYLEQMAAALDHAHDRGVIHRDIKPANILMTPEKRLLLTDFGLVKIIADTIPISNNPLSEAGTPMGTPDYMSPEQVIGKEIDPRADIYSLGVLLYHMVTGTVPFKGDLPMKVALQHLHTQPPLPRLLRPDLPPAAEQVILRALAKKPQDRYANARDMASTFRLALEAAGVQLGDNLSGNTSNTDEHIGNRKRGLFDPLWRTAHHSVAIPLRKEQEKQPKSQTHQSKGEVSSHPIEAPIAESQKETIQDIVAQTKMTLPSFTGILTEANIPLVTASAQQQTEANPIPVLSAFQSLLAQKEDAIEPLRHPTLHVEQGSSPQKHRGFKKANMLKERTPIPETPQQDIEPHVPGQQMPQTPMPIAPEFSEQQIPFPTESTAPLAPEQTPAHPKVPATPTEQKETAALEHRTDPTQEAHHPRISGIGHKTSLRGIKQAGKIAKQIDVEEVLAKIKAETAAAQEQPPASTQTAEQQTAASHTPPTQGATTHQLGHTGTLPFADRTGTHGLTSPLGDPNNPVGEYSGDTGMLKLNQAVKVVKIPIAGRPGEFKTGILPMLSSEKTGTLAQLTSTGPAPSSPSASISRRLKGKSKQLTIITLIVLGVLIGSIFLLTQTRNAPAPTSAHKNVTGAPTINVAATETAAVQATATFEASIIVEDSLSSASNGNGWLISGKNYQDQTSRQFVNGAYRMCSYGDAYFGASVLSGSRQKLAANFNYTLTTQAIAYNKGADNNYYGMVIRYNQVDRANGKGQHVTFYALSIYDLKQPKYRFVKVDNDKDNAHMIKVLFEKNTGKEFHGVNKTNTITISAKGGVYTFLVNGVTIGKAGDGEYTTGGVGMGVAGNGTDVAFTNLLLSNN